LIIKIKSMWFVGIDVSSRKGNAVAILNKNLKLETLFTSSNADELANKIFEFTGSNAIVAIDAPRIPSKGKGWGRKCEKILAKLGYRPLWTPPKEEFKKKEKKPSCVWMEKGFLIYKELYRLFDKENIIEVYPSAAYGFFKRTVIKLDFNLFTRKNRTDELDAICSAVVAYFYYKGGFCEDYN